VVNVEEQVAQREGNDNERDRVAGRRKLLMYKDVRVAKRDSVGAKKRVKGSVDLGVYVIGPGRRRCCLESLEEESGGRIGVVGGEPVVGRRSGVDKRGKTEGSGRSCCVGGSDGRKVAVGE